MKMVKARPISKYIFLHQILINLMWSNNIIEARKDVHPFRPPTFWMYTVGIDADLAKFITNSLFMDLRIWNPSTTRDC